ncbi:MAG: hypothetical protein GWO20_20915, partial [Candidatus Korarchaeota archaeon]|nr:hypothetical protein [Candidatus Korarchaeota archaeon]
ILIAKGKKASALALYYLLADGELDSEINALREQATAHSENGLKVATGAR